MDRQRYQQRDRVFGGTDAELRLQQVLRHYCGTNARTYKNLAYALARAGVESIDQANAMTDEQLLAIRGVGANGIASVRLAAKCESDPQEQREHRLDLLRKERDELIDQMHRLSQRVREITEALEG